MKFLKDNTIVDIREAKEKDAAKLLEYFRIVGSESPYLLMDERGLDISLNEEIDYLSKAAKSEDTKYFIALAKDEIIGEVALVGHKHDKTKHNADLAITVKKAYWHKGLGSRLMEHAINYARITGKIKNIYLEVREDNISAIKLYEKFGFIPVGKMPDKIYQEGEYLAEFVYLLQIS
ncbi:MAG: GNAT family N-acetyltransferase [Candidatus Izemoplasmatales bacterium]|nr:GNAT family N-acetyltransferase [Candidatus Izemoplasmatales bacterium]